MITPVASNLAYWATALAADLIEIKYNKLASRRWAQFLTQINAYRDSKGEIRAGCGNLHRTISGVSA